MASLGHLAIGMLVGRLYRPESPARAAVPMAIFSGLSLLPDLDYVGVMLGVPNVGPCGHRGASHSLVSALLIMLAVAALAPRLKLPRWRAAIGVGLVIASHPILDAMTSIGRGVPLLWPFSFHRFESPWRPIPDAPCGLEFISMTGLRVACVEFLQFFPLLVFALRPAAALSVRAEVLPTYRVDPQVRP